MRLSVWSRSDPGRRRDHNEDNFAADATLGALVVCDGMGGHQGGATASRMAVEGVIAAARSARHDLAGAVRALSEADDGKAPRTTQPMIALDGPAPRRRGTRPAGEAPLMTVLRGAVRTTAERIFEAGCEDPALGGMGTTLTALLVDGARAYGVHAGDSRAYLLRDGRLRQLTEDHTWIAEQLRMGLLRDDQIASSPYRHVITRSIGFDRTGDADAFTLELEPGDGLLLCSDGLSNYVDGDELTALLVRTWWAELPELLIEVANQRGGDDNITVVAARIGNDA